MLTKFQLECLEWILSYEVFDLKTFFDKLEYKYEEDKSVLFANDVMIVGLTHQFLALVSFLAQNNLVSKVIGSENSNFLTITPVDQGVEDTLSKSEKRIYQGFLRRMELQEEFYIYPLPGLEEFSKELKLPEEVRFEKERKDRLTSQKFTWTIAILAILVNGTVIIFEIWGGFISWVIRILRYF